MNGWLATCLMCCNRLNILLRLTELEVITAVGNWGGYSPYTQGVEMLVHSSL